MSYDDVERNLRLFRPGSLTADPVTVSKIRRSSEAPMRDLSELHSGRKSRSRGFTSALVCGRYGLLSGSVESYDAL